MEGKGKAEKAAGRVAGVRSLSDLGPASGKKDEEDWSALAVAAELSHSTWAAAHFILSATRPLSHKSY